MLTFYLVYFHKKHGRLVNINEQSQTLFFHFKSRKVYLHYAPLVKNYLLVLGIRFNIHSKECKTNILNTEKGC